MHKNGHEFFLQSIIPYKENYTLHHYRHESVDAVQEIIDAYSDNYTKSINTKHRIN
jgi:hypothetical protein